MIKEALKLWDRILKQNTIKCLTSWSTIIELLSKSLRYTSNAFTRWENGTWRVILILILKFIVELTFNLTHFGLCLKVIIYILSILQIFKLKVIPKLKILEVLKSG